MYVNEKEFEAVHAAIDFIISNADGADEDVYPNDIIDGLISLRSKIKDARSKSNFKSLVNKELTKLRKKNEKRKHTHPQHQ